MWTEKCWRLQMIRAILAKLQSSFSQKIEVQFFGKNWTPLFLRFVSATFPNEVAICHVASVACLAGNGKNALFNGLLFVWGASEHM